VKITRLAEQEKQVVRMDGVKDAFKQVPLGRADGTPTMSVRVFTLEPGGYTPQHAHPYEHLNYVIEGKGHLWSEEGLRDISQGDFILVNPDERHQYRNPSDKPLVFVCLVPKAFE
jgi:quercetin dioxygenase-like cupin family protein